MRGGLLQCRAEIGGDGPVLSRGSRHDAGFNIVPQRLQEHVHGVGDQRTSLDIDDGLAVFGEITDEMVLRTHLKLGPAAIAKLLGAGHDIDLRPLLQPGDTAERIFNHPDLELQLILIADVDEIVDSGALLELDFRLDAHRRRGVNFLRHCVQDVLGGFDDARTNMIARRGAADEHGFATGKADALAISHNSIDGDIECLVWLVAMCHCGSPGCDKHCQ